MSSAPRDDDAAIASISTPREEGEEEKGNGGVNARRRIAYSMEFLLTVGSTEACKTLPVGVDLSKHPDDVTLWLLEAASRASSSRTEAWRVRSAGRSGGSQGDSPQRAREPESFQTAVGSKSKPCTRFFRYTKGEDPRGHSLVTHDIPGDYQAVASGGILGGPVSAQAEKELPMEQKPAGHHAPDQATKPNNPGTATAALARFGASATAKISVDASLADLIIGRGGATIKQISRASGAKLCIRDHESDAGLNNVDLEGTFDQIKNASEIVMEQLSWVGLGGDAPQPAGAKSSAGGSLRGGGGQWDCFKTRLCGRFARGCCTHGDGCRFAHGEGELRRPVYAAREPGGW